MSESGSGSKVKVDETAEPTEPKTNEPEPIAPEATEPEATDPEPEIPEPVIQETTEAEPEPVKPEATEPEPIKLEEEEEPIVPVAGIHSKPSVILSKGHINDIRDSVKEEVQHAEKQAELAAKVEINEVVELAEVVDPEEQVLGKVESGEEELLHHTLMEISKDVEKSIHNSKDNIKATMRKALDIFATKLKVVKDQYDAFLLLNVL